MKGGSLGALADAARSEEAWWLDAYYRRQICLRSTDVAANWLQYGHALKELGRFDDAEQAYRKAIELDPTDAEIALQFGHFAKLAGRLHEARQWLERARDLHHGDTEQIRRELWLIDNATAPTERIRAAEGGNGIVIYVSAAVPLFNEDSADAMAGLGATDYSYAFAMRNFIKALEEHQFDFEIISHPEYIPSAASLGDGRPAVHIGFYPPEQMRFLKKAYNIICFAWEFERLRTPSEQGSYHAFADQANMLRLPNEVWVPSREAAAMLKGAVGDSVRYVPAPIAPAPQRPERSRTLAWRYVDRLAASLKRVEWQPLAILPRLQGVMNTMAQRRQASVKTVLSRGDHTRPPTVFLTVLNVHDYRKQLRPMLEGFLRFAGFDADAVLLIKLTTPDRRKLTINEFIAMDQVSDPARLIPPMVSERIWITDTYLTAAEMRSLYDLAAFYVCTSYAEGQNLPLLEAMSAGVVPVSVDVTAMADYINAENAIVIPSAMTVADNRISSRYSMHGIRLAHVEADDVAGALASAAALDVPSYAAKSAAARAAVTATFTSDRVAQELDRVHALLSAGDLDQEAS